MQLLDNITKGTLLTDVDRNHTDTYEFFIELVEAGLKPHAHYTAEQTVNAMIISGKLRIVNIL